MNMHVPPQRQRLEKTNPLFFAQKRMNRRHLLALHNLFGRDHVQIEPFVADSLWYHAGNAGNIAMAVDITAIEFYRNRDMWLTKGSDNCVFGDYLLTHANVFYNL